MGSNAIRLHLAQFVLEYKSRGQECLQDRIGARVKFTMDWILVPC